MVSARDDAGFLCQRTRGAAYGETTFRTMKVKSSKIFSREARRKARVRSPITFAACRRHGRRLTHGSGARTRPVGDCLCPKESERPPPLQNADHITDPGNTVSVWERNYRLVRPSPSPGAIATALRLPCAIAEATRALPSPNPLPRVAPRWPEPLAHVGTSTKIWIQSRSSRLPVGS